MTTGIAADGVFSPIQASTRFVNYETWEKTRNIAWTKIEEFRNVDLSQPPPSGTQTRYDIRLEYDKPIDDAFVGDLSTASKIKTQHPVTGKKKKGTVYSSVDKIEGVSGTFTRVVWDKKNAKWVVTQHFPLAEGWDNAAQKYDINAPINMKVNLP